MVIYVKKAQLAHLHYQYKYKCKVGMNNHEDALSLNADIAPHPYLVYRQTT